MVLGCLVRTAKDDADNSAVEMHWPYISGYLDSLLRCKYPIFTPLEDNNALSKQNNGQHTLKFEMPVKSTLNGFLLQMLRFMLLRSHHLYMLKQ